MKKVYIIILAIAALALSAVSCDIYPTDQELVESELDYVRGEADLDGCYDVYFPTQDASGDHTFDPTAEPKMTVTVARSNTKGDIVVPISVSATPDNVFNIGEIKFADGQSEASIEVSFPTAALGTKYECNIQLVGDEFVSKYSDKASTLKFSVLRVEWQWLLNPKTGEPAKVTFNEIFWEETHTGYIKYYEVDGVRTCFTVSDPVVTEDGTAYGFWGTGEAEGEGEFSFVWYTDVEVPGSDGETMYDAIEVPVQTIWHHPTYDEDVKFYDYYAFWTVLNPQPALVGVSFADFAKNYGESYPLSYYDGNGGFYFYAHYYYMIVEDGGWGIDDYDPYCIAEGFTRVDYSLEATFDYPEDGILPVYFEAGADVVTVKYATAEGELTPSQTLHLGEDVAAGTAEGIQEYSDFIFDEESEKNYGAVGLEFEESGMYTFVAVGFDKDGNAQETSSFSFQYVAADDESFDVDFRVGLEPTPERFGDAYDEYSTLGFWLAGSDITDVKYGLYKISDLDKYGLDVLVDDVRSGDSASEDLLGQVNAPGGYASVVTKLADGVTYVLVAWATNGAKSKIAYATYATVKYPETWHSLGTGLYTEDAVGPLFGADPISYEVEIEESDDTPGRIRLINPYCEAFPYNSPGDWDDSQDWNLIIDAADPDHVYIKEQLLGVNWGYGIMSLVSDAARYMAQGYSIEVIEANGIEFGKLVDGVITMPTKGLILFDDDGGYYANTNGAFEVILPSAYNKEAAPAAVSSSAKSVKVSGDVAFSAIRSYGVPSGLTYERAPRTVISNVAPMAPKTSEKSPVSKDNPTRMKSQRFIF